MRNLLRISPIISFSVNLIIYAVFDEDLSEDLSAPQNAEQPKKSIYLKNHSLDTSYFLHEVKLQGILKHDMSKISTKN